MHVIPAPASPKLEPTRAAVLGEFGGLGLAAGRPHLAEPGELGLPQLHDAGGPHRRLRRADRPPASADRIAGPLGRGLHADDRRRDRSQRPDDLRPRGHQARSSRAPAPRTSRSSAAAGDQADSSTPHATRRPTGATRRQARRRLDAAPTSTTRRGRRPRRLRHAQHARQRRPHGVEDRRHLAARDRSSCRPASRR